MHHVFGAFTLYPERAELVGPEGVIHIEPKAFAVLRLLVENRERVVSRDEMIAVVWGGRFVSDAAVSTALKFARKAVGDDGEAQAMIRTVHGVGHRFVAPVERRLDATSVVRPEEPQPGTTSQRPTIAVLAFAQDQGEAVQLGDGLADEIISSLARLRWLRVIARESTFRFRQDGLDLAGLRRVLGAGYALTGRVELVFGRLHVTATLIETQSGSVVWADRISPALDDLHLARQEITAAVIGALDLQISQAEAATARTRSTEMLDAWGAYHLGMSHLVRFNAHDNATANALFQRATELDPGFATAYAAWSFARFQDAMQWFQPDHDLIVAEVRKLAERAVELDPLDPFANLSLGRWHWLVGSPDDGLDRCERALQLSPNFSKAHYSRGMIDAFAGRSQKARQGIDVAMHLSPLDPMIGPMLTARALSYLVEGNYTVARDWVLKAARGASTHTNILVSTVAICEPAGDPAQSAHWTAELRGIAPDLTVTKYLRSLPVADPAVRARIRGALKANGIPE